MALDILLIIIGMVCLFGGIAGCFIPVIPGPPLNYVAIILLHLTSKAHFSTDFLIIWALVIIIVQILDYYVPVWGTKKLGGGKKGAWGSFIGIFAGIFVFPPWGILFCPFIGAVLGELLDNKNIAIALKAGFGAFLGFLAGVIVKLTVALILSFYFFKELIVSFS